MTDHDKSSNQGQQKVHRVRDTSGNVSEMTQEQWKNRDKNAGLTRVDDEGTEIPESDAE